MLKKSAKGAKALLSLPGRLEEMRSLFEAVNWPKMQEEVGQESASTVAILGPVNAGKSTLFNAIEGSSVSKTQSKPGTTREIFTRQVGPFSLLDTPGFGETRAGGAERAALAMRAAEKADLIVFILDGTQAIRPDEVQLYKHIAELGKPMLVVLNKIDLLGKQVNDVLREASRRFGAPVVPISALQGTNVATQLIPRILGAYPALAVAIGRSLPAWRQTAARKVVRKAALANAALGLEPIPGLDIPFLLATQTRMIMRLAAIYGEPLNVHQAKELITTIAGGLLVRYLGEEASKAIPVVGWLVASGIAAAGTYAMGEVAIQYFENGKTLSGDQMRGIYRRLRKSTKVQQIREEDLSAGTVGPEIYIPALPQDQTS